jgi:hypothetical protein
MAKVTKNTRVTIPAHYVAAETEDVYTLELTEKEAIDAAAVLGKHSSRPECDTFSAYSGLLSAVGHANYQSKKPSLKGGTTVAGIWGEF